MKVLIREGLYSPEEIADLLLLSVGDNRLSARKVLLSLPKHPKPRANELAMKSGGLWLSAEDARGGQALRRSDRFDESVGRWRSQSVEQAKGERPNA
jgi:hypothetical protein